MTRYFFRTSLVHSCFSPELCEKRPEKCRCRKYISRGIACEAVRIGMADWVIDYSGEVPLPTWNITLLGRAAKTPRAHTIEKAHIERGVEQRTLNNYSDDGQMAKDMENIAFGNKEVMALFEEYHDVEMEARYALFGQSIKQTLLELKKKSDTLGLIRGESVIQVLKLITERADKLKFSAARSDPYEGRAILPFLGWDGRTRGGHEEEN